MITAEQLEAKIAKCQRLLDGHREDMKSSNAEIAGGAKHFVAHHEQEMEILLLAKKGLGA